MATMLENESAMGIGEEANFAEGRVARTIEHQTAKLPSDLFLWAGLGALGASWLVSRRDQGTGMVLSQLAPVLLLMGVYNKLVKLGGHDQVTGHQE